MKATDQDILSAARNLQAARVASDGAYDAELAAQRELAACKKKLGDAQEAVRRASERLADLLDRDHREPEAV